MDKKSTTEIMSEAEQHKHSQSIHTENQTLSDIIAALL